MIDSQVQRNPEGSIQLEPEAEQRLQNSVQDLVAAFQPAPVAAISR